MSRTSTNGFVAILAIFLAIAPFGLGHAQSGRPASVVDRVAYSPDIQRIYNRGKLIVAMYHKDIPPFFMKNRFDRLIGYDVEMARDLGDLLGVKVEFNRTAQSFSQIIETVVGHEADLAISIISATLTRAEIVRFSEPYLTLHPTLVINRLTASRYSLYGPDPLRQLRQTDQKIGVKTGTSYVNIARELFKRATIVEYEDWDPAMKAVQKGEVLATLRDEIGVNNYILMNPDLAIKIRKIILREIRDPIAVAVPVDSPHLLALVDFYVKYQRPEITADDLMVNYKHYYQGK